MKIILKRLLFVILLPIIIFYCFIWACLFPLFWIFGLDESYLDFLKLISYKYFLLTKK
jgi:hypothetical protein